MLFIKNYSSFFKNQVLFVIGLILVPIIRWENFSPGTSEIQYKVFKV